MRLEEQMCFHGMEPTDFTMDVSKPELAKQIGNAMSQCVVERLLNKLIPAVGFANQAKTDRWESGEAVKGLEMSRDQSFMKKGNHEAEVPSEVPSNQGEIHFWNPDPVFRYYRLPNRWSWIKWDSVTRIIHKCGGSGRTLFDEAVTDENRHDQRFLGTTLCCRRGVILDLPV